MTGGGGASAGHEWTRSYLKLWRELVQWYLRIPTPVRLVWGVFLTCLITASMASTRGVAVALFAAVVYGGLFVAGGVSADRTRAWSRRHPWLDGAILAPLLFLALADCTHLALLACALVGLGAYAISVPLILVRRRGGALG